jgi:lipid-A-disaccharide synthase
MSDVLLSVGDASGDGAAADFVAALVRRRPGTRFAGLGGPEMEKAGVRLVADSHALAVGGLLELLPDARGIARAWRALAARLRAAPPDLVVLVDSSGFNLPLAKRARRLGCAVLYYVAPQVWAWRPGRARVLAGRVDRLAVTLPFEVDAFAVAGIRADFVGHPLVDRLGRAGAVSDPVADRLALGLDPAVPMVALLPGSRRNEVRHILPVFLETARILHARDPRLSFALPVAPGIDRGPLEARVRAARLPAGLRIALVDGRSHSVLRACDVAVVKPGTGSLEAALLGRPQVVAGRGHPLSAAIVRRLVRVPFMALPNLIAGTSVVPEFLQAEAVPARIADATGALRDGPARAAQLRALADLRARLGPVGAAERVADIAEEMLDAHRPS